MRVSIQTNGDGSRNMTLLPGETYQFANWTGKNREIFRIGGVAVDHPEISFASQFMYNFGQWCSPVFMPGPIGHEWQVNSAGAFLAVTTP